MSVLVVLRRRARAGCEEQLVAEMLRRIEDAAPAERHSSMARLFQARGDPADVLYIGTWASREEYWARYRGTPPRTVEALSVAPAERRFMTRVMGTEIISARATALGCAFLSMPADCQAVVEEYLRGEAREAIEGRPGFVLRYVYRDIDTPGHLLIMHGWETMEALTSFLDDTVPILDARLHTLDAEVTEFIGRLRGGVDRLPTGRQAWHAED